MTVPIRITEEGSPSRYGPPLSGAHHGRIRQVVLSFSVLFTLISLRLMQLHLSPGMQLTEEERFHIGQVDLHQPRGDVVDRNGLILATDRKVPSIWADPRRVGDVQRVAMLLSARLGLDENELIEQLSRRDEAGKPRKFVWLARWLRDISEQELEEIVLPCGAGVQVRHEPLRYYPQGDTAAHLVGFVNRAGEASEGLELTFDGHLASVPGSFIARKDSERQLLESLTLEYREPEGGETVHLTLDMDIQHTLEHTLDKRMEECNASGAMGIVLDAHTGAILALANRPAFDPNVYDECDPELRKNRGLLDMFEPGSAFKIVTASAALELGLVTPETMIDCEGGAFNPYGHRIRDFHKLHVEPFSKCFEESSNIAIIKVGAMLGPERLEQWIRRFGFGARSCGDFQFESPGRFRPLKEWSGLSMGSLPMGQEIAVTMPQLARAFAVIANGGFLVSPYFVERAVAPDGTVRYQHVSSPPERILSPATAETMQRLCHLVVAHGTGKPASIPEYRAGGKTGTAQIARATGGGYEPDKYTTIFAGFAPVNHPRLVAVIVIKEPMIRLHYGGYVCGPVFREVVRDALIRFDVPKDPMESGEPAAAESMPEAGMELVEDIVGEDASEELSPAGQPVLAASFPAPGDQRSAGEGETAPFVEEESLERGLLDPLELVARPVDTVNTGEDALPDLTGMTKRQAMEALAALDIPWDPQGSGWVVSQNPPAGTPLSEVTLCAVELAEHRECSEKTTENQSNDKKRTL